MKVEKFIIDFAEYEKTSYNDELVNKELAAKAISRIDKVVNARKEGLISVHETIYHIINAWQYITEE